MGIPFGAEMTTFEMRFIALRCKIRLLRQEPSHTGRAGKAGQLQRQNLRAYL